jgi:magnesium-transporting ATPase (P-type)
MTVVIKDEKGNIKVLCKGADSVLQKLLARKTKEQIEIENKTNEFLESYA